MLNVNIPANPSDDSFKIVNLCERMYTPHVEKRLDPRGKPYYWIGGEPYESSYESKSDGYALRNLGKTTITPIKIDMTGDMASLHEWLD